MKDLLLVIDMQNVYMPGGPWACPSMPEALEQILKLLEHPACGKAYDVIFTRYIAPEEPSGRWEQYNESNQRINESPFLNQIVPQLQSFLMKWRFCDKSTYSACSVPVIMDTLGNYDRILMTGVVAECCVLSTLLGLIDTGAHVIYLRDAVAGRSGSLEQTIQGLAEDFSPIHTQVMDTDEYLTACCRTHSIQK